MLKSLGMWRTNVRHNVLQNIGKCGISFEMLFRTTLPWTLHDRVRNLPYLQAAIASSEYSLKGYHEVNDAILAA